MKEKVSMKVFSRSFNLFLATVLVLGCACPIAVSAASKYTKGYVEDGWYRIRHPASGKYVDVSNVSMENGAYLHLWDKAEGNQNQIFHITRNTDGTYVIIANHSKKAVEVRNSSMDDYGEVAQWDYGEVSCQQWRIARNEDKTYSFTNANSGLNMSVLKPLNKVIELPFTNETLTLDSETEKRKYENGEKLVQYQDEETTDDEFELIKLSGKDILMAEWTADPSSIKMDSIKFDSCAPVVLSEYGRYEGDMVYFPSIDNPSVTKITYMNYDAVVDMVSNAAMSDSTVHELQNYITKNAGRKAAESGVKLIAKALFKGTEAASSANLAVSIFWGFCDTFYSIASMTNNDEWNKLISTSRDALHQTKGIYITDYISTEKIQQVDLQASYDRSRYIIEGCYDYVDNPTREFDVWDCKLPQKSSGSWTYIYK